jgi:hypothetical protein
VEKLIQKNNSCKMTERSLNSLLDLKAHHTLYITSSLMTQFKSVKSHFQIQVRIRSLSHSRDRNFPVNLLLISQDKHMLKISLKPKNFLLVNVWQFSVENIYLKDVINSQEIIMVKSSESFFLKISMFLKTKDHRDQVIF